MELPYSRNAVRGSSDLKHTHTHNHRVPEYGLQKHFNGTETDVLSLVSWSATPMLTRNTRTHTPILTAVAAAASSGPSSSRCRTAWAAGSPPRPPPWRNHPAVSRPGEGAGERPHERSPVGAAAAASHLGPAGESFPGASAYIPWEFQGRT